MKLLLPFSSDRFFIVHSYVYSHGLLLLRSRKTDKIATRIDILFQDVRVIELRFWFEGINIEEGDQLFLRDYKSKPQHLMEHGNCVYALKGRDWTGFIVAGIVSYHEDDKEQNEPSALLPKE